MQNYFKPIQKFRHLIKAFFCFVFFFKVLTASSQEIKNYFGFAVGPETALALPKIGTYIFTENKSYVGLDISPWVIFSFWCSANLNGGIVKNNISYEAGLSYWYQLETDFGSGKTTGPSHHMCFNPKIGLKLDGVWIKIGPGFVFDKNYRNSGTELIDITKFGGLRWNFDLIFKIKNPN